jgi:antiviral helicase SKI2
MVLFATETFAMGVNMPARAVAFNGTRKHDGRSFRQLLPGEYTQMAGRAGRRGLDRVGTVVVLCWDEVLPVADLHKMLKGSAMRLESQFRLTYTMILRLLRVEDMTVEDMIKRSFSEVATQRALGSKDLPLLLSAVERRLARATSALDEALAAANGIVAVMDAYEASADDNFAMKAKEWLAAEHDLLLLESHIMEALAESPAATRAFTPGRVVFLRPGALSGPRNSGRGLKAFCSRVEASTEDLVPSPAVVLRPPRIYSGTNTAERGRCRIAALAPRGLCADTTASLGATLHTTAADGAHAIVEVDIPVRLVSQLCKEKLPTRTWRGVAEGDATSLATVANRLARIFEDSLEAGVPRTVVSNETPSTALAAGLTPASLSADIKVRTMDLLDEDRRARALRQNLTQSTISRIPPHALATLRDAFHVVKLLSNKQQQLQLAASNESLALFPDFKRRCAVLRRLGYVDADSGAVQLKGRVACEINTMDELLLTELVFENVFEALGPAEIAAVLSAGVFQRNVGSAPTLTPTLAMARRRVEDVALSLGTVQMEAGLDVVPDEFQRSVLRFGLAEVVYEWARGVPFATLCELTDVDEGSIVRCITRLDETCREVRNAARIVGDPTLYRKMEEASTMLKRDIVFASSLYVA